MRMTRREFVAAAGIAGAASVAPAALAEGGHLMTPGVNPVYLTGSSDNWPLAGIAAAGCTLLEITPERLAAASRWLPAAEKAGLRIGAVNAMPELRPYLSGSLIDGVPWRRDDTLKRLTAALATMSTMQVPFLVVASSRLAENYQSEAQARALWVDALRRLSDAAGTVTVLIEGAPFRLFAPPAELAAVIDEVARPNVAAALNVGHAVLAERSLDACVRTLGPRLRYVQVHDAILRPGYARLDRHLPPGEGTLKAADVRAAIGSLPSAFTLCAPERPVEALQAAMRWLRA